MQGRTRPGRHLWVVQQQGSKSGGEAPVLGDARLTACALPWQLQKWLICFLKVYVYFLNIIRMCVCLDVSMHICKQVRSEARGARSPGGLGSLAVLSCQRWVLRTELGSSARAHTCNVLKILFLIICIYVGGAGAQKRVSDPPGA